MSISPVVLFKMAYQALIGINMERSYEANHCVHVLYMYIHVQVQCTNAQLCLYTVRNEYSRCGPIN
jgi:hypothetical protein